MSDDVMAVLTPSPARRFVSLMVLLFLGVLLVYLGLVVQAPSFIWQMMLIGAGLGVLVLAEKLRRATAHSIILTSEVLRDSAGRELCKLGDVAAVERGAFAFKPSHGFVIRTRTGGEWVWAPGLWWRFGRRIGVGGATPAGQAKFMAEMIAVQIKPGQAR